jgi:hypothetical protein
MIDSEHKEKTSTGGGGAGGDASCLRSVDAAGPCMVFLYSLLLYHCVYVVCMDREGWSLRDVILDSVAARKGALALYIAGEVSWYRLLCKRRSTAVVKKVCSSNLAGFISVKTCSELRKHF